MPLEPYPLTNAIWKSERAKCHLDELMGMVRDFCADSHSITIKEELERDQIRYCVYIKQPHVSLYLVCGDYLQCLRTALDQAVWSLINHRTDGDADSSEFPVFPELLNAKTRPQFRRKTEGLSPSAIEYIESIQPYNRTAGFPLSMSPLWCLHELNRIDKHRRISIQPQIAVAQVKGIGPIIPGASPAEVTEERTDYGMDVVLRGAYKHIEPEITSIVIFSEPKSGILLDTHGITQLYNFVTDEVLVSLASRAE